MSRYTDQVWYCPDCDTYAAKKDDECRCQRTYEGAKRDGIL